MSNWAAAYLIKEAGRWDRRLSAIMQKNPARAGALQSQLRGSQLPNPFDAPSPVPNRAQIRADMFGSMRGQPQGRLSARAQELQGLRAQHPSAVSEDLIPEFHTWANSPGSSGPVANALRQSPTLATKALRGQVSPGFDAQLQRYVDTSKSTGYRGSRGEDYVPKMNSFSSGGEWRPGVQENIWQRQLAKGQPIESFGAAATRVQQAPPVNLPNAHGNNTQLPAGSVSHYRPDQYLYRGETFGKYKPSPDGNIAIEQPNANIRFGSGHLPVAMDYGIEGADLIRGSGQPPLAMAFKANRPELKPQNFYPKDVPAALPQLAGTQFQDSLGHLHTPHTPAQTYPTMVKAKQQGERAANRIGSDLTDYQTVLNPQTSTLANADKVIGLDPQGMMRTFGRTQKGSFTPHTGSQLRDTVNRGVANARKSISEFSGRPQADIPVGTW